MGLDNKPVLLKRLLLQVQCLAKETCEWLAPPLPRTGRGQAPSTRVDRVYDVSAPAHSFSKASSGLYILFLHVNVK